MSKGQTILVLGGGVGGIVTAVDLRKKLPARHRVVLVDRQPQYLFAPSLLWLLIGLRKPETILRPLVRLRQKGVEVVQGVIEQIDPAERRVTVDGETLAGDHLVVSLGAEFAPGNVPGLAEAGHNFYTLAGATNLRDAIKQFRSGRLVVLTTAPVYKCPAAPYEAAMLLEYDCRKRRVRDEVNIEFYAAEPGPMGVAGAEVSASLRRIVVGKDIGYHPEHQVMAIEPSAREITFANGVHAPFDLLAYVPPHRAPRVVVDAGLVGDSGWVPVDRHTLETKFHNVYAIGDVAGIPLKLGKPLPKAGVFAHGQGEVVAQNIAHVITGEGKPARFDGHGECFIETGDGRAAFGRGNFYADPTPQIKMFNAGRHWHASKLLFEKDWLRRWF